MDGFQLKGNCQNNYQKLSLQVNKAIVIKIKFYEFLNDSALKKILSFMGKIALLLLVKICFGFPTKKSIKS